jgi:hypothetical protein
MPVLPITSSRTYPVSFKKDSLTLRNVPSDNLVTTVGSGIRSKIVWKRRSDARSATSASRRSCMSNTAATQRVTTPASFSTGTTRPTWKR